MNFRYKAKDPLNRVVTGELDGNDPAYIERELKGRALTPVWIRPAPVAILDGPGSDNIFVADAARQREASADMPEKSQGGVGWGTSIFILIYILLQMFGLL